MELPLKRLALFSSGVGFFEHSGIFNGPGTVNLVFNAGAVNDALKSLTISDAASEFPSVSYASASALAETLKSLKIDLSGKTDLRSILDSLKGAEIDISAPTKLSGRIAGVEKRVVMRDGGTTVKELYLLLFTGVELKAVAIRDIASFSFKDETITADLNRALNILSAARDDKNRSLAVSLPGTGKRNVSLSYVIPVPVWKVSYRLDLGAKKTFIQGWAIVDNDSDTDWNGVALSLVTGRPVSFIQNLSEPYLTSRPELPLAIAGIAKARTYESGEKEYDGEQETLREDISQDFATTAVKRYAYRAMTNTDSDGDSVKLLGAPTHYSMRKGEVLSGTLETARAKQAGEQFEFTLKNSVTIERRQSAMLPLIEAGLKVEKLLVLSGSDAQAGTVNPSISVELVNTTGMKLPAGPITVYDAGTYAGDALIAFLPENEKRLISYGEDLSVRGSAVCSGAVTFMAAVLSKGVLTVSRTKKHEFVYTIRNASSSPRNLIIEHPVTPNTSLVEPLKYEEKTPALYRFAVELPANKEIKFTVAEEEPLSEDIGIGSLSRETALRYSTDKKISADIRSVLKKAADLMKKIYDDGKSVRELERKRDKIVNEQERIRQNLLAAGNQTAQGQQYLSTLVAMDDEIDVFNKSINEAGEKAAAAKKEFENVIGVPLQLKGYKE